MLEEQQTIKNDNFNNSSSINNEINKLNLNELKNLKNEISHKINLKETKNYNCNTENLDLFYIFGQSRIV